MAEPDLTVVVPTHNPDPSRLRRTLTGLAAQTLAANRWELLLVDNASSPPVRPEPGFPPLRLVREEALGLTAARRRGFAEARGAAIVLVDDDNVLAPDYLAQVLRLFAEHPEVGALGGKSLPEFERPPEAWQMEFLPLLALRDLGDAPAISHGLRSVTGESKHDYPVASAPIGAGMAIRREAARQWSESSDGLLSDRRGRELASSGDNDIVLTIMRRGWEVGYFPELALRHLIPASRLDPEYLARLNYGIQKSWLQVLLRHEASPWPQLAAWTVPLRQAKAWFTHRGWARPAGFIRWRGACGHFQGRAARSGGADSAR
ncbi:MAG TPA: glycosyltransferase [Opitutaceae bacterium]|nr:glycosyltransferase [Opitutaceae bacterium]